MLPHAGLPVSAGDEGAGVPQVQDRQLAWAVAAADAGGCDVIACAWAGWWRAAGRVGKDRQPFLPPTVSASRCLIERRQGDPDVVWRLFRSAVPGGGGTIPTCPSGLDAELARLER